MNGTYNNYASGGSVGTGIFYATNPFICNAGYFISNTTVTFAAGMIVNGTDEDSKSFYLRGGTFTWNDNCKLP